jgi:hypothetical protein
LIFVIKYLVLEEQRVEKVELEKAFTVLGLMNRKHEAQLLAKEFSKVLIGLGRHSEICQYRNENKFKNNGKITSKIILMILMEFWPA